MVTSAAIAIFIMLLFLKPPTHNAQRTGEQPAVASPVGAANVCAAAGYAAFA